MTTLEIGGKNEVVFSQNDFEYLVEKYMGVDAARYLSKCLHDANEAVRAAKEGLNTDLASYEASLEDNTNAFLDIQENVEVISNALLQNRLNREKIAQANRRIAKILSSQI